MDHYDYLAAANARMALTFALSPGQAHDALEGRKLLHRFGKGRARSPLMMDRVYEGDATRQLALELGVCAGGAAQAKM